MNKFAAYRALDVEMVVAAFAVRESVDCFVCFTVSEFKKTFFGCQLVKAAVDRRSVYRHSSFFKLLRYI